MLELTAYGLVGLAAMLIIAFYFAYGDEVPSARETFLVDLVTRAQMIETGTGSSQYRRTIGKKQEAATASLPQKTVLTGTRPSAICSDNCQSDGGQVEVFHG
jgi:hypothetical protein